MCTTHRLSNKNHYIPMHKGNNLWIRLFMKLAESCRGIVLHRSVYLLCPVDKTGPNGDKTDEIAAERVRRPNYPSRPAAMPTLIPGLVPCL